MTTTASAGLGWAPIVVLVLGPPLLVAAEVRVVRVRRRLGGSDPR